MTSPYAPPKFQNCDEPTARLPDGIAYIVVGDDLFCRNDLDISRVCYITGAENVVTEKDSSILCLSERWHTYSSIALYATGVTLLVAGFLAYPGSKSVFLIVWMPFCLGMAIFGLLRKKVKIRFGLSQAGKRARWKRLIHIGIIWGIVYAISTAFAVWLSVDREIIGMGFGLCTVTFLFRNKYRSATARECPGDTYRIRNLSPALLATLRNDNCAPESRP